MNAAERLFRAAIAAPLLALLLTLGVAVPVLERADVAFETAVESEHHPSTCPTPHDHTVCTQVGSNLGSPSGGPEARSPVVPVRRIGSDTRSSHVPSLRGSSPPARGPPAA